MNTLGERFLTASQKGDLKVVQSLVSESEQGILQCTHSKSGDQATHMAARHGHLNILIYLGELGVDCEGANLEGKRPLHEAAAGGWTQCVEYLLQQQQVVVDPLKRADWTPLHLACTKSNPDVVKILVQHGARPQLKNKDGWNSFHIACREGHTDILELLLDCPDNVWNTVSRNGRTPLHTIALHGRLDACKLVLSRCCYETDVADSCGSTPLMDAVRAGYNDVAEILIQQHKADVLKEDILGRSSVHLAAQAGHQHTVSYLVSQHNVDVDIATKQHGHTALHLAAKEGHSDMISTLFNLHGNMNQVDFKGRTALHIAAGSAKVECVQVLVNCGARQICDKTGKCPGEFTQNTAILDILKTAKDKT